MNHAKLFLKRIEEAQNKLLEAEQIAWNKIHEFEDCNCKECEPYWEMEHIASHLNWEIDNNQSFNWNIIEKEAEK